MQNNKELIIEIKTTLEKLNIPKVPMSVFGAIKLNVHIVCMSRSAIQKWAFVLNRAFSGCNVRIVDHYFEAKINKGTTLKPTMRKGFLLVMTF